MSGISGNFDFTVPIRNQAFEYVSESVTFRGLVRYNDDCQWFISNEAWCWSRCVQRWAIKVDCCIYITAHRPYDSHTHDTTKCYSNSNSHTHATTKCYSNSNSRDSSGASPVIESVTLRYDASSGSLVAFQDIAFRDPDGDAYKVHYELVHATVAGVQVADGTIDISSQQQKLGTTITGKWACGGNKYDVTLRVTILDRAGNQSNTVEYTMNCR